MQTMQTTRYQAANSAMSLPIFCPFIACVALWGCSTTTSNANADASVPLHTFDLGHYSPDRSDSTLAIANKTLAFPLGLGEPVQALSASMPGDLVEVYTRVGCSIQDPARVIGLGAYAEVHLPSVSSVHLTQISIEELRNASSDPTSRQLGEQTCFTYRSSANEWRALIPPSRLMVHGDRVIAEVDLDVRDAEAVAIFLPTFTHVSKITYRAARD
jgi:hypothetical protein